MALILNQVCCGHHAIFTFPFLSMYFCLLELIKMSKGLGEESRMSWRGNLSSKSITITWRIYPPGVLVCLSSLCFQWPWAMWVYLLLLGGELLEGIEICQEGQLFLTAGAWPWSFFSLYICPFFLSRTAVNCTMSWLDINELPPLSTLCLPWPCTDKLQFSFTLFIPHIVTESYPQRKRKCMSETYG